MPPEEFWHGNYMSAYRKAYRIRKEERNYEMWLQGLYIYDAVLVAINNAFNKRKIEYMKKPIDIFPPTEEEKERKLEEQRKEIERKLTMFAERFNGRQQHSSGTEYNSEEHTAEH